MVEYNGVELGEVGSSQLGLCFFFQAEDGIRSLVRSRGLGDVYKGQVPEVSAVGDELERRLRIGLLHESLAAKGVATPLLLSLIHI